MRTFFERMLINPGSFSFLDSRRLLVPLLVLVAVTAACSGDEDGTVEVLAQGRFRAEVPSGWQVLIPRAVDDDELPVFAAGPRDGDSSLAVFLSAADSAAAAFQERADKLDADLGAPEERRADGRTELIAIGTQLDRATGKEFALVFAAVRLDGEAGTPVVICALGDLSRNDCERFVDSLKPALP